jgi:hypothetical protein
VPREQVQHAGLVGHVQRCRVDRSVALTAGVVGGLGPPVAVGVQIWNRYRFATVEAAQARSDVDLQLEQGSRGGNSAVVRCQADQPAG